MTVADWLTVVAIILGPLFGAFLAIGLENLRTKRERRLDIFRTLMRTRRTPMWPDHVGVLNLVEIEFHGHPEVITKWRKLFEHLGTQHNRRRDEDTNGDMTDHERKGRENRYWQRLQQERHEYLTELLHTIGKVCGFKTMEQLEIFKGGYIPQGWNDIELENTFVRRLFSDIYQGRRIFPIGVFHFPGQSLQDQEAEGSVTPEPASSLDLSSRTGD